MADLDTDRVWSTKDVQRYLGVGQATVARYRAHRGLPFLTVGGLIRYNPDEVMAWVRDQNQAPPPAAEPAPATEDR